MKTKIVGIIVCMLLVTTTIVSATQITHEETSKPSSYSVEVPIWTGGDTWIYEERYSMFSYKSDGTYFTEYYHNMTSTMEITDDTGDTYKMKLTSKGNEGKLYVGPYRLRFTPLTRFSQEITIRKSDLANLDVETEEKGWVFWLLGSIGIPFPAYFSDIWDATYDPAGVYLPFPFTAGVPGTIPEYTITGHETMGLYWGLIKFLDTDFEFEYPEHPYNCEMTSITVPAGSFDAYNVSQDWHVGQAHNCSYTYYVPDLGYYAQHHYRRESPSTGRLLSKQDFKLISTTYTP